MPDLSFTPDTREEILLAMVVDRLDALLAALRPEPAPTSPRKRAPKRTAEEA